MIVWRDNKSHSRLKEPNSSECKIGPFRLIVHRHKDYPINMWLATCWGVFECVELKSEELLGAKCQAVAKLQVILETAVEAITSK